MLLNIFNCSACHKLVDIKNTQKVILNAKKARICQDCVDELNGSMSHNKLVENLNNGKYQIR